MRRPYVPFRRDSLSGTACFTGGLSFDTHARGVLAAALGRGFHALRCYHWHNGLQMQLQMHLSVVFVFGWGHTVPANGSCNSTTRVHCFYHTHHSFHLLCSVGSGGLHHFYAIVRGVGFPFLYGCRCCCRPSITWSRSSVAHISPQDGEFSPCNVARIDRCDFSVLRHLQGQAMMRL